MQDILFNFFWGVLLKYDVTEANFSITLYEQQFCLAFNTSGHSTESKQCQNKAEI